VPAQAG